MQVKKPRRRAIRRRRDADEVPKGASKYSRRGLTIHCTNCGSADHDRRGCPSLSKKRLGATNLDETQQRKRGRPPRSRNRIRRNVDEETIASTAIARDNIVRMRNHKGRQINIEEDTLRHPWMDTIRGRSRRRGRGRGRGRASGGIGSTWFASTPSLAPTQSSAEPSPSVPSLSNVEPSPSVPGPSNVASSHSVPGPSNGAPSH